VCACPMQESRPFRAGTLAPASGQIRQRVGSRSYSGLDLGRAWDLVPPVVHAAQRSCGNRSAVAFAAVGGPPDGGTDVRTVDEEAEAGGLP